MAMIKPNFTQKQLEAAFAQVAQKLEQAMIRNLQYLGEKCVTMSRKALNIDPSAFPINYGDDKDKKVLQQRVLYTTSNPKTSEKPPQPVFGDYKDQTGNLRNSIGYAVIAHGVVVTQSSMNEGGSGLISGLKSKYKSGYALIVVAGMDYAVHVESKGYNVISSSEKYAENYLPTLFEKIKKAVLKK